ncbi:Putative 115 kDa protein in type-1 retrotransposable element R1DM [Eumeta japonica]|uniref:115 kDa protein in type-1 retrotransposable element R1DM n=1 Tax=Eumeta variegata TaxID=151549 RepID=A0A4C1UZC5_EUMVA|nr:Putative 115 kDa protein in type-1 retrotransposable element R1DM [Eumeta japonica]
MCAEALKRERHLTVSLVSLQLAKHKKEAVLITSRIAIEIIELLKVGSKNRITTVHSRYKNREGNPHQFSLRVASAFLTISEEAECVISETLPLRVLAEERRNLYQRKRSTTLTPEEQRTNKQRHNISRWQQQWDATDQVRWTHRLIPRIDIWLKRNHGEVNYYLTQMLSGHGCFRAYLHRFKHDDSSECPSCPGVAEDTEHILFVCPRFNPQRDKLEKILNQRL